MTSAVYLLILLFILFILYHSGRCIYERFQGAGRKQIAYSANKLNTMEWLSDYDVKSIPINSAKAIYSFIEANRKFPADIVNGSLWTGTAIEYDLFLSKSGARKVLSTTGYHVQIGLPAIMYAQECAFNWHGKRIGYIEWSDYYLIKAIMRGYRIPDDAVEIVEVPISKWTKLIDFMSGERIDALIAFIIPGSPFHKLLLTKQLSVVGWGKLDMDRVSIFHPYVKSVQIDMKDVIGNKGASSLLVMDREKNGPVLEMEYNAYSVNSDSNANNEEGFITRLDITPESIDPGYRCYGDLSIEQKALCESPFDSHGEPKVKPTIWDRPCVRNEDCPFYKANKRYRNNRGGCLRGGICEMPVGVLRTAFRTYDDTGMWKPFCYGCSDPADADCCSKQGSRPDYAFAGDYQARRSARQSLYNPATRS